MEGGDLARLWKGGKHGYLSPLMQAKAWGLSEAGVPQDDIAAKLEKVGGGHPTQSAVSLGWLLHPGRVHPRGASPPVPTSHHQSLP